MATRQTPPRKTPKRKPAKRAAKASKPKGLPPQPKPAKRASKPAKQPTTAPSAAHQTVAKLMAAQPAPEYDDHGLKPEWNKFLDIYLVDFNATQAYMQVYPGVDARTAGVNGCRLLANARVKAERQRRQREFYGRQNLTKEEFAGQLISIIQADPNEISHVRVVACPFCWGNQPPSKTNKTGRIRLTLAADPDPNCPMCEGEGQEQVKMADTRKLSPEAHALYTGLKVTQSGVQITVESKDAARAHLARMFGWYEIDNGQKTAPLIEMLQALVGGIHTLGGSKLPIARKPAK